MAVHELRQCAINIEAAILANWAAFILWTGNKMMKKHYSCESWLDPPSDSFPQKNFPKVYYDDEHYYDAEKEAPRKLRCWKIVVQEWLELYEPVAEFWVPGALLTGFIYSTTIFTIIFSFIIEDIFWSHCLGVALAGLVGNFLSIIILSR